MPSIDYQKHLVECNCVLPQFKHSTPPVWHRFVAFSEIDEKGNVIPSFSQCNNCNVIHKVTEIGVSTILKKESLSILPTIEDVKQNIPEKIAGQLERFNLNLTGWQEVAFIFEHKVWGKRVILSKEEVGDVIVGKTVLILGESLWKFDNFQIDQE